MSSEESLKLLQNRFYELQKKLNNVDKAALREKKYDFEVMGDNEVKNIIVGNERSKQKMKMLLTQIGYLRINLFNECYARIQLSEENLDFKDALKNMDDYIENIAMPYLIPRMRRSLLSRLKGKLPEATSNLQNWRSSYESWLKEEKSPMETQSQEKVKHFNELKQTFITLYTLSFHCENFPPVCGAEEREFL